MYQVVASYPFPENPEAFLSHYRGVHVPLVRAMPHLEAFDWMLCDAADGARPEHFLVARLTWASREVMEASMSSPEGQAGSADLANLAPGGIVVDVGELVTEHLGETPVSQ